MIEEVEVFQATAKESYRKMWANQIGPKFKSISQLGKEEQHPRLLSSQEGILEIAFVVDGSTRFTIDVKDYYAKTGDVLIFNAGTTHDEFPQEGDGVHIFTLSLTDVQLKGCPPNCLVPAGTRARRPAGHLYSALLQLFQLLWEQQEEETAVYAEITHHLSNSIFLLIRSLFEKEEDEAPEESTLEEIPLALRVKEFLDEHFTEDLSLHFLSKKFNISPYYLAHLFKKQFNYSPVQYILRRRLGLAQTLLITTNLSVGQIAAQVGYSNPSHFNILFTKNVGIAPRKYRMNYIN